MNNSFKDVLEIIQKIIVKSIARNPQGVDLCLIGGFRLRLLDNSPRRSIDVDYHYPGELELKQKALILYFKRKLIPAVKHTTGYDGNVTERIGLEADSHVSKIIDLAFYKIDMPFSRIEVSVDLTHINCADKPIARTIEGTVFLTVTDPDMIESKIIALFDRLYVQERDIIDIFLFKDKLVVNSPQRIASKLQQCSCDTALVVKRFQTILQDRMHHIKKIDAIISEQLEPVAAENIRRGGGAEMVFELVMDTVRNLVINPGEHVL